MGSCCSYTVNVRTRSFIELCRLGLKEEALSVIYDDDCDIGAIDNAGNTSLIYACDEKMDDVAVAIIDSGKCTIDHINHAGLSALSYACKNSMSLVAMRLVALSLRSVSFVDGFNKTPLDYAITNKLDQVALVMLENNITAVSHINSNLNTPLIIACNKGRETVAMKILSHNKSLYNHVNKNGDTALIWACANGMINVCLTLLGKEDIAVDQVNIHGNTALVYAADKGLNEICIEIMKQGHKQGVLVFDAYSRAIDKMKIGGMIECLYFIAQHGLVEPQFYETPFLIHAIYKRLYNIKTLHEIYGENSSHIHSLPTKRLCVSSVEDASLDPHKPIETTAVHEIECKVDVKNILPVVVPDDLEKKEMERTQTLPEKKSVDTREMKRAHSADIGKPGMTAAGGYGIMRGRRRIGGVTVTNTKSVDLVTKITNMLPDSIPKGPLDLL